MPVPPDTLLHWAAVKATTEDKLRYRGMWYGLALYEADTLRAAYETCDSTRTDLLTIAANEEQQRLRVEEQYRNLDRRTIPKGAAPWLVAVGLVIGLLLGR